MTTSGNRRPVPDEDPELWRAVDRFVLVDRRYLELLGGIGPDTDPSFLGSLRADAEAISDRDLERLLGFEWRARLTAAYLVAASGRSTHRDRVAALLVSSDLRYGIGGLVTALASFGDDRAAEHLAAYLEVWSDRPGADVQKLAVAALRHLLQRGVSTAATQLVAPGGAWHSGYEVLHLGDLTERVGHEVDLLAGR